MSSGSENKQGLDAQLIRRIISYLEPYKGWVAIAFITVMTVAFLGPLRPKLIQITIDQDIVTGDLVGLRNMIALLFGILDMSIQLCPQVINGLLANPLREVCIHE